MTPAEMRRRLQALERAKPADGKPVGPPVPAPGWPTVRWGREIVKYHRDFCADQHIAPDADDTWQENFRRFSDAIEAYARELPPEPEPDPEPVRTPATDIVAPSYSRPSGQLDAATAQIPPTAPPAPPKPAGPPPPPAQPYRPGSLRATKPRIQWLTP